jgi:hypothetical protein
MKTYLIVTLLLFSVGCAHAPNSDRPSKESMEPPTTNVAFMGPISLTLKSEKGRKELTVNCSETVTESFEDKNILHKRIEVLDFRVQTLTKEILPNGNLRQDITTTKRDGPGSLHDLAYPELGEVLDMELTPKGKVIKAGKYPPESLFYLPSIPLPDHPVKQNEEWVSTNTWKSETSGAPLTVDLHEKVIGFKKCGSHNCANIVVTGAVLFPKLPSKSKFSHLISGRFLFDPESGLVPWSEFLSEEEVNAVGAKALVHGRLRSELLEPRGYRTINREEPTCPYENKAE